MDKEFEYTIESIKRRVTASQCAGTSILGTDQAAKAIVIEEIKKVCEQKAIKLVEVDMEAFVQYASKAYFYMWKYVLDKLEAILAANALEDEEFSEELKALEEGNLGTALELAEDILDYTADNELRLVFLFKNFDAAKIVFADQAAPFQFLRAMQGADHKLSLVFESQASLSDIEITQNGVSLLALSCKPYLF